MAKALEIVYAGASGNLYLANADGSGERELAPDPDCHSLAVFDWSPDGQHIACAQASDEDVPWIKIVDLDGNVTTDFLADSGTFSWAPSGSRYAYSLANDADASLTDLFVGTPDDPEISGVAYASNPVWLPDGRLAAYRPGEASTGPEPIAGIDIYTGNEAHFIPVGEYRPLAAVRGSDALLVAGDYAPGFGAGATFQAWILDVTTERLSRVPELDGQPRVWVAPGGRFGVFVSTGDPLGDLWVIDFESLEARPIAGSSISAPKDSIPPRHIAFTRDGSTVYWADAFLPLGIYRASLAGGAAEKLASIENAGALEFAPDFSRIAYIVPSGALWVTNIDGSDPRSLGPALDAFAWRPVAVKLADSQSPTAGICGGPSLSDPATIEFHPDVPAPRCLQVLETTHLRLVNQTDEPVDFELGAFRGSLTSGGEAVSDLPVGEFLAAGVHVIQSTAYGPASGSFGGSAEVWVLTEEMAERVELVIHRVDGTDQVLHLLSEPIVCGQMEEIIELCGEQIVDGQIISADFIQVNQGLGETYEVHER